MKTRIGKFGLITIALIAALSLFAGCGQTVQQESKTDVSATPAAVSPELAEPSGDTPGSPVEDSYAIGITQIVEHPSLDLCRRGAIDKLAELGFIEGQNLKVTYQSAQGEMANATTIAQQFVADKVDVMLAIATPSAQAAYSASMGIVPVVFSAVSEPAAAGLAGEGETNIAGVTGTSDKLPIAAMFKLIKDMTPNTAKVGILHNTGEVNSDMQLAESKELAPEYGFEIIDVGITSTNEMASALDTLLPQVDVVMNLTDNMVVSSLALEVQKCNEAKIPLFGSEDTQVTGGALASAGVDYYSLGQRNGEIIADILKGKKAEEIPIEISAQPMIVVSQQQAELLGLTIPDSLKEYVISVEAK